MRLFFDSRHRLPSSPSSSDFTLQLLETIQLRPGAKVRLHDVSIPYSWRTVEAGVNNHIFLEERPTATGVQVYRRLAMPAGQYDGRALATILTTLFNLGSPGQWPANPYTVTYNDQTGSLSIQLSAAAAGYWAIWDDLSLAGAPEWSTFSTQSPATFNRNLRISEKIFSTNGSTWVSQFLDLLTIHDIYVCSNLSRGSKGPRLGQRDCLAKVAVTSGFGYIIHREGGSWEHSECSVPIVSQIQLSLRDSTGAAVPLHGCDWIGCLTFDDPED
jgi:hypothetical protein